jgi:hypothetical protein
LCGNWCAAESFCRRVQLYILVVLAVANPRASPEKQVTPARVQGKRIFQQLRDDKLEDIAKEFNAQVTTLLGGLASIEDARLNGSYSQSG